MFILYYATNTCSLAAHIALEDAGADYELRRIDFTRTEQQSPAYLKVNSKARVPAMVTPRGILTETPAMLAFIAQMRKAVASSRKSIKIIRLITFGALSRLPK